MKWSVGTKIGATLALTFVLILCLVVASWYSVDLLLTSARRANMSRALLTELDGVYTNLAEAEASQRSYLLTGEERWLDSYGSEAAAVGVHLKDLKTLAAGKLDQARRAANLEAAVNSALSNLQAAVEVRRGKGLEVALQQENALQSLDAVHYIGDEVRTVELTTQQSQDAAAESRASSTVRMLVAQLAFDIVLLFGLGAVLTRHISQPLQRVTMVAERLARGDLTVEVPPAGRRNDEVGMLQCAFASMVANLSAMIRQIQEAVRVLGTSANEILASTTQVATGATETATAVSETTTTVEEVRQTAQLASQKARYVSDSAQKAMQVSQTGQKAVDQVSDGMGRIRVQMQSVADSIVRLSEQSQAIGEIMSSVNDLAEQSNLLAVNAAIEAAKAGEQGKGFAVVAQEIRSLAEQSKQATGQVRTILNDVQKAVSVSVMATEQGGKAVDAGARQTDEAGAAIRALADSVQESAQAATQIAASSQQQVVGMDQVALAMESIKLASAQNVAGIRQTESAAQSLQGLGQSLTELVQRYKA
jgi:methyl-accepting chemotaxis protein